VQPLLARRFGDQAFEPRPETAGRPLAMLVDPMTLRRPIKALSGHLAARNEVGPSPVGLPPQRNRLTIGHF
jgi:hypothetical protein